MAHPSPLHDRHTAADAMLLPYGPPESPIDVPGAFDALELEYAALRKGCVLVDAPHRATIEVTGTDRLTFLDAMITQRTRDLAPFTTRRSFWLTKQGRIVADLRLTQLPDRMLIDVDPFAIDETLKTLDQYLFAEDAELVDATASLHPLWLMGPTSARWLELAAVHAEGPAPADLEPDQACLVRVAGADVVVERTDLVGDLGFELTLPADSTALVWDALAEVGVHPPINPETGQPTAEPTPTQSEIRGRPAGWLAINTARIEAGVPLFNVDFGTSSLPGESGVLRDRVDFKKGCYLGQEIVARMDSRGALKQRVAAVRFEGAEVPASGVQLHAEDDAPVGVVTSSTLSPMLGSVPIALATIKQAALEPGTKVTALTPAGRATGVVQPELAQWRRPNA
ncbi:MAG: glycine cleavage T C-terminal barrel domain-containing protein [Phycisphaerales bacterium]